MTDVQRTPWLSILIPVYNVADYLNECIQSIINQCDDGVEIIMLDDQSTDNSFAIMKEIAAKSTLQIKAEQNTCNSGISAVRNNLLAAASGNHLWFIDSDDVVTSSAIEELRKIVEIHDPILFYAITVDGIPIRENLRRESKRIEKKAFTGHTTSYVAILLLYFLGSMQKENYIAGQKYSNDLY